MGAKDTCCLDVADRERITLSEIGDMFGVVRQRIEQIEIQALRKLRIRSRDAGMRPEDVLLFIHPVGQRTEDQ